MPQLPTWPAAATLVAALASPSFAQTDLDLQIPLIQVNQAIQTGSTQLVAGKTTVVRVPIQGVGTIPGGAATDGILRVLVDGVEIEGSPLFSLNGPIDVLPDPTPGNIDASLNFALVMPEADNVEFVAEINLAGPDQLDETDFDNNVLSSGPQDLRCVGVPDVVYVPVDYRPNGETTPQLPPLEGIEPGAGDNFFTGIMPGPDVNYRRSDAPSKLWTSSLSFSGSSLNSSLLSDLQMMNPQPDFIYGWVPGGLPYNGQAIGIPGQAAMGNTEQIRYQRTMAHEVGHLIGLSHNGDSINNFGFDVESQLNFPLGLDQIQVPNQNDIMVAGQITSSAWVDQGTYNQAINNSAWACTLPLFASAPGADGPWNARRLLVSGVVSGDASAAQFDDVVAFAGGVPTQGVELSAANVVLRAWIAGELAYELPLSLKSSADLCSECRGGTHDADVEPHDAGFALVLPATVRPNEVEKLELVTVEGEVLVAKERSAHAPEVRLATPSVDDALASTMTLAWTAEDADGDALQYSVRYSPDGTRMVPLASRLTATEFEVPLGDLPTPVGGQAYFEVLATDGLRTTRVATTPIATQAAASFAGGGSQAPFTFVMTPDEGFSFPRGATVLLHGSVQDLDEGPLGGNALLWTSSLDGPLANGRVASVADLSVGTHVLTLTATDSTGVSTSDSVTIEITDRNLPDLGIVCQTDLGFGSSGTGELEVCGGNLSMGTFADLKVSGATPNDFVVLSVSAINAPVDLFGGTVITNPSVVLENALADETGSWTLSIPGGNGPRTFFAQAFYSEPGNVDGVGVTNAIQLDFLP
ncbi:MAG: hypothetical protein AAFZ65_05125 [Planctomycetota bacterium]